MRSTFLRPTLVGLGLLTAACGFASTASAVETVPSTSNDIRVRVTGRILPSCELEQSTRAIDFDLMDQTNGGVRKTSVDLPFAIDCNASFVVRLRSANGGLAFQGAPSPNTAFRRSVDYRAALNLPAGTRAGGASCGSQAMTGADGCARTVLAEDGVAGNGSITLHFEGDAQPLLRGRYADSLTLTVTPRIGGDETE